MKGARAGGYAMVDHDVEKIVDKMQKLRALRHARERVRQLERELNGAPAKPDDSPQLPEYLRRHNPLWMAE
jgi:predicted component of type VI protein secretion system